MQEKRVSLEDLDELSFYEDDGVFVLSLTSDEAWAFLDGEVLE